MIGREIRDTVRVIAQPRTVSLGRVDPSRVDWRVQAVSDMDLLTLRATHGLMDADGAGDTLTGYATRGLIR